MVIYSAIFLATLSTVLLPIPEEATLLAAGYAARLGRAGLAGCALAAWLAVMLGDALSYAFGRVLLSRVLRTRLGRTVLPDERRVWAERMVVAQGWRAIVVARFLVGLRGFLYFAVGASRYSAARFFAINAAAGVVEVGGLVALGFWLGELRARVGVGVDLAVCAVLFLALFGPAAVRAFVGRTRGAAH